MEHEIVDLNGLRFNALSVGPAERDAVILLHGFPQFADVWTGMMHALAAGGLRAQAFDQRGYSPGARPLAVEDYDIVHLTSDVLAFTDQACASKFHLIGHDWGGFLAWKLAAEHPERVGSLCVLSIPHVDAFLEAVRSDVEQQDKSKYIQFFRMPGGTAESVLLSDGAQRLRSVYQGKLAEEQIEANVRRLSEPGALTAALNWYRALDLETRIGNVAVPTLFLWGDQDLACGKQAAMRTAQYVSAPYRLELLKGYSHWLLEEAPGQIAEFVLSHIKAYPLPGESYEVTERDGA
jgi:pimeloyl-ACP methyl ester carboxylesterase